MASHRSLKAWIDANGLAKMALRAGRDSWKPQAGGLFSQLQRAALSIQLNIAHGAAVGTEELLQLALDEAVLPEEVAAPALESCRRCQRLRAGLIKRYRNLP